MPTEGQGLDAGALVSVRQRTYLIEDVMTAPVVRCHYFVHEQPVLKQQRIAIGRELDTRTAAERVMSG